ncbi:MAG: DUF3817 domain-containing protein [Bacteroidetes bacterium]|nr:DUF3817 domain-containing protein [Bacteroidota bacterium]
MKKIFQLISRTPQITWFPEGTSLLLLVLIAVPMKYWMVDHSLVNQSVRYMERCFWLFVFNALQVGVEQKWKFMGTTMKVLIACIVPFGTLY